jgi:hypothetical protein
MSFTVLGSDVITFITGDDSTRATKVFSVDPKHLVDSDEGSNVEDMA